MEKNTRVYDLYICLVIFRLFLITILSYEKNLSFNLLKAIKTLARGLSWFEKLKNLITPALHDESFMSLNETQFVKKKQLKEVSHGKTRKRDYPCMFLNEKLFFPFSCYSFWLFTKK